MSVLLHELREARDDFVRDVGERTIAKQIRRAKADLPVSRLWLIDSYREADCGLEIGIRLSREGYEPTDFIAVLVRAGVGPDHLPVAEPANVYEADDVDDQLSVFVAVVEVRDGIEIMVRRVRSFVRLYLIEEFARRDRYGRIEVGQESAVRHIRFATLVKDRELGSARTFLDVESVAKDDLAGEVVERAPQVVDGIPKDQREGVRDLRNGAEAYDIVRMLCVVLHENSISAKVLDPLGFNVQLCQMNACPIEFGVDTFQGTEHVDPFGEIRKGAL
jgi:hypothetical protein